MLVDEDIEPKVSKSKYKFKFQFNKENLDQKLDEEKSQKSNGVYASIYFMDPEDEKDDHFFIVFQKLEGD